MPAIDQKAARRRYLDQPDKYAKHVADIRARVQRNLEKLPELFDECDECGLSHDLRVFHYTDKGIYAPTTLSSKARFGWGMKRLSDFVRDNDLLCGTCAKEMRLERRRESNRRTRAKNT